MTFSTPPVADKNTFYVDNGGTWELFDDYDSFSVKKRQNQLSAFEVKIYDISTIQKAYFKENSLVLFFVGTKLLMKGRIQKIEYGSAYEVVARGYSMGVLIADDIFIKSGDNRVQYTNISAQTIAKEVISENSDGNNPYIINSSAKGLFNSDYGPLSMRFENTNRLNSFGEITKAVNGEWWVEQDPSDDYNADYIYLDSTKGLLEDNIFVDTPSIIQFGTTVLRVGQKRYLSASVTKLQFQLYKSGSPTGNVTFTIRKVSDDSIIVSQILGDASIISSSTFTPYEVTFTSPIDIDEEVYINCEFSNGAGINYISILGDLGMNLPKESTYRYDGSNYTIYTGKDLVYKITLGPRRSFDLSVNATKTSQDRDFTNLANKVTILGYGDGINQLKTTLSSQSVTNSQLSADITDIDTTINLLDATGLSNGDHIIIAEEEVTIGTISGNILSGCTRGINNTLALNHKKDVYVEKSSDEYEFYSIHDSTTINYGGNFDAQSFTVGNTGTNETFTTKKVRLYLNKIGNPSGSLNVKIQAVDGLGKPDGVDLAVGSIKFSEIKDTGISQYTIEVSETDLTLSTKYSFIVTSPEGDVNNYIQVGYQNTSGTYLGGERLSSTDSGGSWTIQTGDDIAFEIWGFTAGSEDNASTRKYGKKGIVVINRNIIDQTLLELIASKTLLERKTPIIRINVTPDEPMKNSILNTGDIITINDVESDISGDFRIIGIEYKVVYGYLTLEIEVSNRSLDFIEQMKQQRENEQNLSKYMQGSTNIYAIGSAENCDATHYLNLRFFIPNEVVAINRVLLSFKIKDYRVYAKSNNTESAHTHTLTINTEPAGGTLSGVGFTGSSLYSTFGSGDISTTSSGSAHTHGIDYGILEQTNPTPSVDLYIGPDGGTMTLKDTYTTGQTEINITDEIASIGAGNWANLQFRPNANQRIEANAYIQIFIRST